MSTSGLGTMLRPQSAVVLTEQRSLRRICPSLLGDAFAGALSPIGDEGVAPWGPEVVHGGEFTEERLLSGKERALPRRGIFSKSLGGANGGG
jgi:hypothetical protein